MADPNKQMLTCGSCRFSTHTYNDTGKKLCGTPVVFDYYVCHKTPHLLTRKQDEWCAEGLWNYKGTWVTYQWKSHVERDNV